MKKYLLLLFTISFLFLSCAKEEKTKTSFMLDTSGLYQEMIEMEGEEIQAVLMGKTKTGSFYFSQVLTNSVNIEKEIPSGVWDFYVLAWVQPIDPITGDDEDFENDFHGTVNCAVQNNAVLMGGEVNINLSLNNQNCTALSDDYINESGGITFKGLDLRLCNQAGFEEIENIDSQCVNTGIMGATPPSIKKGYAGSVRVKIRSMDNFGGVLKVKNDAVLRSDCIETSEATIDSSGIVIPFGNTNYPVVYDLVQYFKNSDCNPENGIKKHIRMRSNERNIENVRRETNLVNNVIFLKSTLRNICHNKPLPFTTEEEITYSAGSGTNSWPAIFCVPPDDPNISWDMTGLIKPYLVFPSGYTCPLGSNLVYQIDSQKTICVKKDI